VHQPLAALQRLVSDLLNTPVALLLRPHRALKAARVAVARLGLMGMAVIVRLLLLLSAVTVALAEMVLAALGPLALQVALLVLAAREQSLT
jgi:hypothetical protein